MSISDFWAKQLAAFLKKDASSIRTAATCLEVNGAVSIEDLINVDADDFSDKPSAILMGYLRCCFYFRFFEYMGAVRVP